MKDIAKATSLTDPLYETWKKLDFDSKWSKKYIGASLAKQNCGIISGSNGIRGSLQLYYMNKDGDKGIFIQLNYDGKVSIEVARILQEDPLKLGNFQKTSIDQFNQHINDICGNQPKQ